MPIYEYQCTACQHSLEKIQKMSDEPLRDCPECHSPALKKLVSTGAFRLKGGGWYETDFKSGNKKNLATQEAGQSSASGVTSDSKTAKTASDRA